MKTDSIAEEQHPLLPSGDWSGFYLYQGEQEKHHMYISLTFKNGSISASGMDDVGAFSFIGKYNIETLTCFFDKRYASHVISYKGHIDENGIWGKWYHGYQPSFGVSKAQFDALLMMTGDDLGGGFHIWPGNRSLEEAIEESKQFANLNY